MTKHTSVESAAAAVRGAHDVRGHVDLAVGDWDVRVDSNSDELLAHLQHYFRHFIVEGGAAPTHRISAFEGDIPEVEAPFIDWKRDPGKTGRKDAFADIEGGRVCHKVRTGMRFLVGATERIAVGPCLANPNQVVNFVNSQYMGHLLRRGAILGHAAGVVRGGRGLAMAGFSGAGKSTLALHLLGRGLHYLSNDRIAMYRDDGGRPTMSGVPKMPRINPGTALNNPHLEGILPADRYEALKDLPREELWDLEEKYDVHVDEVFEGCRFDLVAPLDAFLVLTWRHDNEAPMRFERVDPAEREDLLVAIMKHPGPFYTPTEGKPPQGVGPLPKEPYLELLGDVPVYELSGGVDFDGAVSRVLEELLPGGET
jgi:HprK-related kinase B